MDLDGGMTPWYGVGGVVPISLDVERTIKRAEICGFVNGLARAVLATRGVLWSSRSGASFEAGRGGLHQC